MGPNTPLIPVLAVFGLVFGSFTTALSYRLPKHQSIARGRSKCAACGHELGPADLIPVASWVVHGGKCRYCRAKISARYPAIELMTMGLFVAAGMLVPDMNHLLVLLAMSPIMVALAVPDLEHKRLPNALLFVLTALALLWRGTGDGDVVTGSLTAVLAFAALQALDALVRKGFHRPGLGMGDAKLLALAGLALSVQGFLVFMLLAGILGSLWGALWRWRKGEGGFAFAPMVVMALWISLAVPEDVLQSIVTFSSR